MLCTGRSIIFPTHLLICRKRNTGVLVTKGARPLPRTPGSKTSHLNACLVVAEMSKKFRLSGEPGVAVIWKGSPRGSGDKSTVSQIFATVRIDVPARARRKSVSSLRHSSGLEFGRVWLDGSCANGFECDGWCYAMMNSEGKRAASTTRCRLLCLSSTHFRGVSASMLYIGV